MAELIDVLEGLCYVIQVRIGKEDIVKEQINKLLITKFAEWGTFAIIPLNDIITFRNRNRVVVRKRLFPGYVFIFGEISNEIYFSIVHNIHIYRFLKDPGEYLTEVPKKEWHLLGKICDEEGVANLSVVDFDVNDRIVVISGALVNVVGLITKVDKRKRTAIVQTEFFDRTVQIKFNFRYITKL